MSTCNRWGMLLLCAMCWTSAPVPLWAHDLIPYENVSVFQSTMEYGGRSRDVLYLQPALQARGSKVPALILLHYLDGTPADMADLTKIARLVRDDGIWVILPKGVNGTWNYKPNALNQVDDVGFLTQLIQQSVADYPLDPTRIYMAGYSDGGLMTQRFACDKPRLIAAGAAVAATLYQALANACTPNQGTPMLFMQGEDDKVLPYKGNLLFLSAPATAAFWARIDGCAATPTGTDLPNRIGDGTTVHLDRYQGCAADEGVAFYSVVNGGHTWPGAYDYSPDLGLTTQDINADTVMWQFFRQFRRAAAP